MYGNEGEKWVMTKQLSLNGIRINEVGTEFEIQPYHSVPLHISPAFSTFFHLYTSKILQSFLKRCFGGWYTVWTCSCGYNTENTKTSWDNKTNS